MSQSYQVVTANDDVVCSQEDYDRFVEQLNLDEEKALDEDGNVSGIDVEYHDGKLYLFAEEFGDPAALSKEALNILGEIIGKAKLPYLGFGFATYSSKCFSGSCGGGDFRVYPDGELVYPKIEWTRK